MKLFDEQPVNTGRQVEADFAKMVCIIGMVLVHAFEEVGTYFPGPGEESAAAYVFVIVLDAIFGAATFMFCMGFGITYSPKADPDYLIRRGGTLLLVAYVLNIVRFVLPDFLNWLITGDSSLFLSEALGSLFCNDILQFAGLALLLFGLLKKLRVSDAGLVIVALLMSAAGSFMRNFDLSEMLHITNEALYLMVNKIAGLLFGTVFSSAPEAEVSCFPLLQWFIFVVAGYLFAKAMLRCKDKNKLYSILFPCGAAILVIYMLIAIPGRIGMMSENLNMYYHLIMPEALICIVASVTVFGMYYGLSRILPEAVSRFAIHISKNLTVIYIFQWVLIGFSLVGTVTVLQLKGVDAANWPAATALQTVLFGIFVLAASCLLAELVRRRNNRRLEK